MANPGNGVCEGGRSADSNIAHFHILPQDSEPDLSPPGPQLHVLPDVCLPGLNLQERREV